MIKKLKLALLSAASFAVVFASLAMPLAYAQEAPSETDPNANNAPAPKSSATAVQDSCDTTGVALTWIICPIFELGVNSTDFIFKDFVEPLLKDVPVSTDPNDGTYIAWKQFRLIGNIVLVGSLLAVVYAQAKGDQ